MTEYQYEHYKELKEYSAELAKAKEALKSLRTQFGGKCMIGNRPIEFYQTLHQMIDVEIELNFEKGKLV